MTDVTSRRRTSDPPRNELEDLYIQKQRENQCQTGPHMDYLRHLAMQSEVAVEFGARGGSSTVALNYASRTISVDFNVRKCDQPVWNALHRLREDNWVFVQMDTREYDLPECDLLFIDSLHHYDQVTAELTKHESVRQWIVLHDTEAFRDHGQAPYEAGLTAAPRVEGAGIWPAVQEFLAAHPKTWRMSRHVTHSNGLTTLARRK